MGLQKAGYFVISLNTLQQLVHSSTWFGTYYSRMRCITCAWCKPQDTWCVCVCVCVHACMRMHSLPGRGVVVIPRHLYC
jgi:hypothetical protein